MKLCFQRAAALAVGLALWHSTVLQAANQRQYQLAGATAEAADSMASYNSVESYTNYQGSDYTPGHMGWGQCRFVRQGQFFIGADYLNIRSTFSEANGVLLITQYVNGDEQYDYIPMEFDYNSSYRAYGGYRWNECGEEIIFGFTNYSTGTNFDSGLVQNPPPAGVAANFFRDPYQEFPLGPNDRVVSDVDVNVNSYDLAFAKTIPICSCNSCCDPCCGSGCDSCCDPCCGSGCGSGCGCCAPCPTWDITWRAGIRFADVDWRRNSTIISTGAPTTNGFTTLDFSGGGPRVGVTGRRYIGQNQFLSIFAASDVSLLLGDLEMTNSQINNGVVTNFSTTQIVPVLDIEAGGTLQVTNNLSLSAGYLFSAWFDLGMRDTIVPNSVEAGAFWDDANILGFDGFFARAELSF